MADTAIVILLGQSLNAWRGTTRELQTGWSGARQLVGGGTVQEMDFYGANNQDYFDWNDSASVATQAETTGGQSPIAGIASELENTGFTRVYLCSVAIPSTDILTIRTRGQTPNMYGALKRLVALASAQGDTDPAIYFYSQHGESDANAGNEADYQADATAFYQRCELAAAQALEDPSYRATFILGYPYENKNPTPASDASSSIAIKEAIKAIADSGDLTNCILYGSVYHWPFSTTDLTHNTDPGQVLRGEGIGKVITDHLAGTTYAPLRLTSVTQNGTTVTCKFTHNIVRDIAEIGDVGGNLNGNDGFEYFDNGSEIAVNSVNYSGNTATLTLASTPTGTDAQQQLRLGMQVTAASGAWPTNGAGAPIRKDMTAWTSTYDVTYDNYDWALQEEISGFPYTYTPPSTESGGLAFVRDLVRPLVSDLVRPLSN